MTRWRDLSDEIKPAIPYVFLFDNSGGQQFTTAGEFHTWDNTRIITQHFTYTSDTDRIYLNTHSSGLFKITFECSFITYDENDDVDITTALFKNGTEVNGARCISSVSGAASQQDVLKDCQTLTAIVYLEHDDYIQIKSTTAADTAASIGDSSRLIIEFIPMQGWDNSRSGRGDYKGGVLR